MTAPKNATSTPTNGRRYTWPATGETFPSVTTILNSLPKHALKNWAAKMVATFAVDNQALWYGRPDPTYKAGRPRLHDPALAIAICGRCPVAEPCLTYALSHNEPHGIWAGTTPEQRITIRRRQRRQQKATA